MEEFTGTQAGRHRRHGQRLEEGCAKGFAEEACDDSASYAL